MYYPLIDEEHTCGQLSVRHACFRTLRNKLYRFFPEVS